MRGSDKLVNVSGQERDERTVRMDFHMAKLVGNIRCGRQFLFYQSMRTWMYVDYKDIVWAYRRMEDVRTAGLEIHSLMLVTRDRKRVGIPVSDKDALEGLHMIQQRNGFADIGYTREKEEKYL